MLAEPRFVVSPEIDNTQLNELFASAWAGHSWTDFQYLKTASLGYVCCYHGQDLIGFVNVAWDGNRHAFILDTTVHRQHQRKGIGRRLIEEAIQLARDNDVEWVHVDYEEDLADFYRGCGFESTLAGLVHLDRP